jgi:hypothetical protein
MKQNRKYMGMTVPQLGVLAGLAGVLCLILCVAGYLIFAGGLSPAVTQNPPTPISTATPIVLPTETSTPLPTAIPYEQLIPQGWKQHKTALMEIWLPGDYRKTTIKDLSISNPNIIVELTLSQTPANTSLYNVYVIIAYEVLRGETLDSHLETAPTIPPETPNTFRVVEQRNVILNGTPAIRFLSEGKSTDNVDVNSLAFVFLDGNTVWYVEYWTQIVEFYNQLETFEKSILTFRPVK